jgi:hypothetical protein
MVPKAPQLAQNALPAVAQTKSTKIPAKVTQATSVVQPAVLPNHERRAELPAISTHDKTRLHFGVPIQSQFSRLILSDEVTFAYNQDVRFTARLTA